VVDSRSTQLLKGTLDMCLLALLAHQPCYGYDIVRQLTDHGLDLVSEGSIYPLLSRLQQNGYIEGYLVSSTEGPKRKYYRLLPHGANQLQQWQAEWGTFTHAVEHILNGGHLSGHDQSTDSPADYGSRECL
jgi:PadR family transcriptional regulator, regulatory protein PadR